MYKSSFEPGFQVLTDEARLDEGESTLACQSVCVDVPGEGWNCHDCRKPIKLGLRKEFVSFDPPENIKHGKSHKHDWQLLQNRQRGYDRAEEQSRPASIMGPAAQKQ